MPTGCGTYIPDILPTQPRWQQDQILMLDLMQSDKFDNKMKENFVIVRIQVECLSTICTQRMVTGSKQPAGTLNQHFIQINHSLAKAGKTTHVRSKCMEEISSVHMHQQQTPYLVYTYTLL